MQIFPRKGTPCEMLHLDDDACGSLGTVDTPNAVGCDGLNSAILVNRGRNRTPIFKA